MFIKNYFEWIFLNIYIILFPFCIFLYTINKNRSFYSDLFLINFFFNFKIIQLWSNIVFMKYLKILPYVFSRIKHKLSAMNFSISQKYLQSKYIFYLKFSWWKNIESGLYVNMSVSVNVNVTMDPKTPQYSIWPMHRERTTPSEKRKNETFEADSMKIRFFAALSKARARFMRARVRVPQLAINGRYKFRARETGPFRNEIYRTSFSAQLTGCRQSNEVRIRAIRSTEKVRIFHFSIDLLQRNFFVRFSWCFFFSNPYIRYE